MRSALIVALVLAQVVAAQVPTRGEIWKGTHAFRGILKEAGIGSVDRFDELAADPKRSVLIVLGDPGPLEALCAAGQIAPFIRAGGAVLLATDWRTGSGVFNTFRLHISGITVRAEFDCYRTGDNETRVPDCPLLDMKSRRRHDIFTGLPDDAVIATNLPSYFANFTRSPPLVRLPASNSSGAAQPFAFGNDIGAGRYLALADHSLFINDMMLPPDTHNFLFAKNVVRWLSAEGQRNRALLYEDGVVQSDFNVSLDYADPPVPPQEVLVSVANRFLGNLQREDVLNRTLLQSVNLLTILRTTIFVFTLGLLLWGLYRFLHSRQHRERLPRNGTFSTPPADLGQRGEALLAQGNLAEAARELARQTFASHGIAAGTPTVIADGWWKRRSWAKRVSRLWNVAVGTENRVAAGDLTKLTAELRALSMAVADGVLRLDAAAPIR